MTWKNAPRNDVEKGFAAMTITTSANSPPRRHCEAKEKIPGEIKFICRSNLKLRWNNEEIASSL
jgi:hypothetical protein